MNRTEERVQEAPPRPPSADPVVTDRVSERIDRAVMWVCAVFLSLMTLDVLVGVFFRYLLHASLIWTEEASRYLMIWVACLAMSSCLKRGEHLTIRFLVNCLPGRQQFRVEAFVRILLGAFLVVLTVYGIGQTIDAASFTSQSLDVNMAIPMAAVPIAGILMFAQLVLRVLGSHHETEMK